MTQCQITVITLPSPQAATSWLVGGSKVLIVGGQPHTQLSQSCQK